MKCSDEFSTRFRLDFFFFSDVCTSVSLPPSARHAHVLLAAEAGPARDPRVAERHHGERSGHHRPGRRAGVEPHRHLL